MTSTEIITNHESDLIYSEIFLGKIFTKEEQEQIRSSSDLHQKIIKYTVFKTIKAIDTKYN